MAESYLGLTDNSQRVYASKRDQEKISVNKGLALKFVCAWSVRAALLCTPFFPLCSSSPSAEQVDFV